MSTEKDYHPLVARLEGVATRDPNRYRLLVALLALLGFAMLGGSLLLSLALSAGILMLLATGKGLALVKLAIIPLALAWSILKSLFVRIEPPQGTWLRPGDAPELQAEVERLRQATGAPRLSGIVVNDEFNASATSVPRLLGLLGHRHVLCLGLPMMQALSREQFLAVVAHEFGHFGGGHSQFLGWIYRVRISWLRVRAGLDQQVGWLGAPLRKFFDWYAPYFGAYSYVLARQNEYEADAASARVVGAPVAAQALVATTLAERRLQERFWPAVWTRVRQEDAPPATLYASMQATHRQAGAGEAAWLREALAETSDIRDTHPSLAQRLQALGCDAEPTGVQGDPAASLLGEFGEALCERLSREWSEAVFGGWQSEHARVQEQRARLDALAGRGDALDVAGRSELACLRDDLDDGEHIAAAMADAVAQDAGNAELNFRLGRRLLDEGDPAGIGAIEAAMRIETAYDDAGLARLHRWFRSQGDAAAADAIIARGRAIGDSRDATLRQRQGLAAGDRFQAHGLGDEQLAALRAAIDRFGAAGKVWIARKVLLRDDGAPHYVLAVRWKTLSFTNEGTLQKFVDMLPLEGTWSALPEGKLGAARQGFLAAAELVHPHRA